MNHVSHIDLIRSILLQVEVDSILACTDSRGVFRILLSARVRPSGLVNALSTSQGFDDFVRSIAWNDAEQGREGAVGLHSRQESYHDVR